MRWVWERRGSTAWSAERAPKENACVARARPSSLLLPVWPVSAANAPSLSNKSYTHTHSPPTLSLPATPTPRLLPQQGLDRPLRAAFQLGQGGREVALQVGVRFLGGQRGEDGLRRWGEGREGRVRGVFLSHRQARWGGASPPAARGGVAWGAAARFWGRAGLANAIPVLSPRPAPPPARPPGPAPPPPGPAPWPPLRPWRRPAPGPPRRRDNSET